MGRMSRFRGHVERRIFNAVLLVLAGCDRPPEATVPHAPPPPPPDAMMASTPASDAAIAVVPVDAPDVAPPDAAVAAVVAVAAQPDAKALCLNYRKTRPRIDPKKARQGPIPPEGQSIRDLASWDPATAVATCTIVHVRSPADVVVMHAPHWCPQGGGQPPAAAPRTVQGEKLLVERVTLRADGTVVKSELEWTVSGMDDEPRHNCGRRFEGLELDGVASDDPGAQLAAMAELEAASIPAFDRLARELASWGAPDELVQRAWRAMRDEVRHARVMTALARRYGHTPRAITAPPLPCRSLDAIARENAIEGCVREAYGALVATYQAERASPALRAAFRAIAIDEARHAELAEDVHTWILGRLAAESRDAVERARTRAELELRGSLATARACRELGLPEGSDALALCDAYFTPRVRPALALR